MPIRDLKEPLDSIVKGITVDPPIEERISLEVASKYDGDLVSALTSGAESLVPKLRALQELTDFDGKMQLFAGGSHSTSYNALADELIRRSLAVGTPKAIEELERFIDAPSFPVNQMYFIGGLRVRSDVTLANGIQLIGVRPTSFEQRRLVPGGGVMGLDVIGQAEAALLKQHPHPKAI